MLRFVFIMSVIMYLFQVLDMFGIFLKKKKLSQYLQDEPYQVSCNTTFPFQKTSSKTAWRKRHKNRRDASISHRSKNSGFVAYHFIPVLKKAYDLHGLWLVIPLLFNMFQRNRNFAVPILVYYSTVLLQE